MLSPPTRWVRQSVARSIFTDGARYAAKAARARDSAKVVFVTAKSPSARRCFLPPCAPIPRCVHRIGGGLDAKRRLWANSANSFQGRRRADGGLRAQVSPRARSRSILRNYSVHKTGP